MLQRKISIAFVASVVSLVVLAATWFTLNYFRVQYYNDSIEGPSPQTSPYWTIIRAQDILHWPIVFAALCVVALLLVIVAHYLAQAFFQPRGRGQALTVEVSL
jgi:hypothetical protein